MDDLVMKPIRAPYRMPFLHSEEVLACVIPQAQEWYREDLVGQAIIESGFPREELFLTSKLHPRHHGYDTAMIQFTKSLASLAVEQVDLFLLHYPACWPELCGADVAPAGRWQDSWRALETLVDKGLVRAIGESLSP